MSGVRILHFLKDWSKFIEIHQYYTMALNNVFKSLFIGCDSTHDSRTWGTTFNKSEAPGSTSHFFSGMRTHPMGIATIGRS